ncbi:Hypothetical predicted protein [Paramuricea clavata]|uniref:Uncharacterized protein n=1 Tax=Paramuricea clavata TaxID=317549 RepID=A0A7D9I020_PARCT|nr:Hypothetical predicted protein [Paramuricea clavata]
MNRTYESIEFEFSDPTSMSDINENWNLWRDTFLAVADECIPTKIVKGRYNPPWLTGEIKSLIKKKETLRRKVHRGTNSAALVYRNTRISAVHQRESGKFLLFPKNSNDLDLRDNILTWFKSYLSGRQQRVLVNGEISETRPVSSGVPQGSILGPLLFLIYINDLPESITSPAVDVSLFADVTKFISVVESPADACVLQAEARNVEKWAEFWRLKFNAEKCKVLSITRERHPLVAEYIVNGKTLQHVSSQKDLGVTVCSDLRWNTHIYVQVTKANRLLGVLKSSTIKVKNVNTRRCLYLTLVRSHLAYASQV